jgi:CRISPR-associated protein Csb2
MVADLDDAFDRFLTGEVTERSWMQKKVVRYRADKQPVPAVPAGETIWLRFSPSIRPHHVLAVTETLRAAVLRHHPEGAAASPVVHGHGDQQPGWHQVRYLPLVEAGHRHAKGRIHGAAIWLPPDATRHERAGIRTAVLAIRRLWLADRFDVTVTLHDGEERPWTANPARWVGPSRRWTSVTPVVQERHGPVTDDEVARWFIHAGHPVPSRFAVSRRPDLLGAIDLPPHVVRGRYGRSPYTHLTVEFDRPVSGPLAVGRGRSFGLGFLAPAREARDA